VTQGAVPVPPKATRAQKAAARKTASVLVEALPYIRRFWGKIVVVKYGGNALHPWGSGPDSPGVGGVGSPGSPGSPDGGSDGRSDGNTGTDDAAAAAALASFAQDVVLMRAVGILPVVVHGGGPQIGELMTRLGKEIEFRDGLRVTDADTLDIARMVLVGKVNRDIVSAINVHGPLAVGMSGEDANLITAAPTHVDLGFVGSVSFVDPTMLERLVAEGLIPVVATIGADESGQAYNINADTVAGALAEALQAEKLIFLTDIEGLRVVADDSTTVIHQASLEVIEEIIRSGGAQGGMMPKVAACARAVRGGVHRAHILDGRVPHALLLELFTDSGVGTMVLP
jgi:acetylglutamate kinase